MRGRGEGMTPKPNHSPVEGEVTIIVISIAVHRCLGRSQPRVWICPACQQLGGAPLAGKGHHPTPNQALPGVHYYTILYTCT